MFVETKPPKPDTSAHQPVMVDQVIDLLLQSSPGGQSLQDTVIDGTVGGGGHAKVLLHHLAPDGRLLCFDRDPNALELSRSILQNDPRVTLLPTSYSDVLNYTPAESASAVLLDLGLSSDQLSSGRGFSFTNDAPLDMRFDPQAELNAFDVVNRYAIVKLRDTFFKYGEEPLSPRVARRIAEVRKSGAIRTTAQLADVIREAVPGRFQTKAVARIFQAIRIEVNDEIVLLEKGLEALWEAIKPGGVLCVISYHSIEDRRMKRFVAEKVKGCTCPPRLPVCVCGRKPSAKALIRAALRPSSKEIRQNPKSRSARLRAAVKIKSPGGK